MAIISIPTSIGGVTIPGNVINGPLSSLYQNKFGRNDLQYPRDLQSATRGHVVHFAINKIDPLRYEELKSKGLQKVNELVVTGKDALEKATQDPVATAKELKDAAVGVSDKVFSGYYTEQANLLFKNRTKTSNESISLYMPDTVNMTYAASYGQTDLLTAFSSVPLVGGAVGAVTQALNNPLARLAMKGMGYALNPNQQVLFDGIDFREYQLSFTFTPYSKQEADTVARIIKLFKVNAAPRLLQGAGGGMFFIPPSTFTPTFKFNGQPNKKINQVTESVITNINVDYAPQGFSTHTDGSPVQTTLTIQFRELELITAQKVEQGY
jgi:hypothetical protein